MGDAEQEHISCDDPRYDGFRIAEYWVLTMVGPDDNQEGLVWVPSALAADHHVTPGPAMAGDARRAMHLSDLAAVLADLGYAVRLRHFLPAPDDRPWE